MTSRQKDGVENNEQFAKALKTRSQEDERRSVRDRLVEVAARHFADHGIQGASQRAIQREAGVNVAAANYYFGSKEALYLAVIEAALSHILPARDAALRTITSGPSRREMTMALMQGYLAPHIREMRSDIGYHYARMLVSLNMVFPHPAREVVERELGPTRERYIDALSRLYPNVPRARLYEVLRLGVGLMAVAPSWINYEHMTESELERIVEDVTETATAAFERLCGSEEQPLPNY